MRSTPIVAASAALLLCACGPARTPTDVSYGDVPASRPASLVLAGQTNLPNSLTIDVLRDRTSGCDWIFVDGYKAASSKPRTRPSGQMCDRNAKVRGFVLVSEDSIKEAPDVVVFRDLDSGCDWIWFQGYKSGSLEPRMNGSDQMCTRYS